MSTEACIDALWRAHLGLSLGLLAVALLRHPLRRLAGPQEAYRLWLLPLLCMVCALLPDAGLPRLALAPVLWQRGAEAMPLSAASSRAPLGLMAWAAGAVGILLVQAWRHWRFAGSLPADPARCLRTPRGSSPGLLGVWRPRLLLPLDFEERFSRQEREWILAHEALHARRHDNAARLIAALLQALAWFNPLAWWALPALRHDQELACDAALLRECPAPWQQYARALLKTDPRFAVPIAASAWQPTHPLKERIEMLKTPASLPAWRRQLGRAALCALALVAAGAVQALQSTRPDTSTAAKPPAAPAAKTTKAAPVITASSVCSQLPKPEIPDVDLHGQFALWAHYELDVTGKPVNIKVTGGVPALQEPVRAAIARYVCDSKGRAMEMSQEFVFNFD